MLFGLVLLNEGVRYFVNSLRYAPSLSGTSGSYGIEVREMMTTLVLVVCSGAWMFAGRSWWQGRSRQAVLWQVLSFVVGGALLPVIRWFG